LPNESAEFEYFFASALEGVGNYEEALTRARRAYEILRDSSANESLDRVQFISGIIYSDLGQLEESKSELRDALAIYRRIDQEEGIIESYNELARIHFVRTEYTKAIEYLKEGLGFCERVKDQKRIARFSGNLGRVYLRVGKWKEAQGHLLLSLESNKISNNLINISCCYLSLGYVCYLLRGFSQSREYYEKALKLIYDNNYAREMAIYHEYSGELAHAQRDYSEAREHYRNAIEIGEKIAPTGDIISQTSRLLAELQIAERQYDEALSSCEKAMKAATSLGEKIEVGAIHRALGQIHSAQKDQVKARDNFEKSISILGQIGAKFELGKAYLEAVRSNIFEYVDCIAHYASGREIFRELGSDYHLGRIALAFCEFLFEIGEYDKAEVYLREPEKIFKRLDEKKDLDLVLQLRGKIDRALGKVVTPNTRHRTEYHFSDIVTQDPQMLALIEEARRFKDSDVPILLQGDSGTGKDLLAKVIHCESKRKGKRFVKVNCAAIPENLLESELFGYKRGAFSGADKDKKGLFEEADGGTILLNEIGDLPLRLQAKILDVIEDKELTRLGEVRPRKVDFRVIAATNKDLNEKVNEGDFREDLYHRLNVVTLRLPPLRERREDIPLLIERFLTELGINESGWEALDKSQLRLTCNWPGNDRQLQNELKRLVPVLIPFDSRKLLEELGGVDQERSKGACENYLVDKWEEVERIEIGEAIRRCGGDKEDAAKMLGISKATLYRRLRQYDLDI
ncbi:MAG: sigma 54-interacting transcriptional regulator, partial [Candidatus Bathyarchaeota archaeon]|nr:sigma 54-interacting transcriptional regulator [Candidatus Bathyarchaeota archaeon]